MSKLGYQKEKLREEYYKEHGHYHLDNPNMYFNWLEEKLVKNFIISGVGVTCCECKGSGGIRMDGTCARCGKPLELAGE